MPLSILPMTTIEQGYAAFKQHVEQRLGTSVVVQERSVALPQPQQQQPQQAEVAGAATDCVRRLDLAEAEIREMTRRLAELESKLADCCTTLEMQRQQLRAVNDSATRTCADTATLCKQSMDNATAKITTDVAHAVRQSEELVHLALRDALDDMRAQHAAERQLQKSLALTATSTTAAGGAVAAAVRSTALGPEYTHTYRYDYTDFYGYNPDAAAPPPVLGEADVLDALDKLDKQLDDTQTNNNAMPTVLSAAAHDADDDGMPTLGSMIAAVMSTSGSDDDSVAAVATVATSAEATKATDTATDAADAACGAADATDATDAACAEATKATDAAAADASDAADATDAVCDDADGTFQDITSVRRPSKKRTSKASLDDTM